MAKTLQIPTVRSVSRVLAYLKTGHTIYCPRGTINYCLQLQGETVARVPLAIFNKSRRYLDKPEPVRVSPMALSTGLRWRLYV